MLARTLRSLVVAALAASSPALAADVVVTQDDLGNGWYAAPPEVDTRAGGTVTFIDGPGAPPMGVGSVRMTTTDTAGGASQAKAQLFTDQFGSFLADGTANPANGGQGVRLADVTSIRHASWRDPASTGAAGLTITLNIEVDYVGDGSSYTTLVWEQNVPGGPGPASVVPGTWQTWDAYQGGNAIWWSTRNIPGACARSCFVRWSQIVAANPNARIVRYFGFNMGSGWTRDVMASGDALELGVNGDVTRFDFEFARPVRIDLRPGSTTNQVNTNANQLVPVAILSDPGFDAPSDVDIASVRAHGAEALQTRFDRSDVDRDGLMDLTVYFRARDFDKPTQEECDDPAAVFTLTGATYDGFRFIGRDRVDWIGSDCQS